VFRTNLEEEGVAKATKDVVAQAAIAVAVVVAVATSIKARGVAAIEVPNRRAIRIGYRTI